VAELETNLDRRILRQLGDAEAISQLEEDSIRPPIAPASTWSVVLEISAGVSFHDAGGDEDELPEGVPVGLSKNKKWFRIAYPLEDEHNVTFPYGAALVELASRDGRILASRLIPVVVDLEQNQFVAELQLAQLTDQIEVDAWHLHCTEIADDRHPDAFQRISGEEVEAAMSDPYIRYDPDLWGKFQKLKERLSN